MAVRPRSAASPSRRSAAPKTPRVRDAASAAAISAASTSQSSCPGNAGLRMSGGVVAAGHPLSAEAGAQVLREGGNAVDAAVCAVLASFAVESPLTGFGAGGFMMVHDGGETTLLDFFVAAPGKDGIERGAELVPVPVHFDAETVQTFYVGPASCGVPGTAAGLEEALQRFGSMQLADLVGAGIQLAREGAPINTGQSYILEILAPIHEQMAGTRELYAPEGRFRREGDVFRFPELAAGLERFAAEGAEPFY